MLHVEVEGSGPPLVLVHGWGVGFDIWRELAPRLRPHHRTILIELPGIGNSPAPDPSQPYHIAAALALEEVRAAFGFETWSVLGYSIGTRVVEAYSARFSSRVDRAVYLCPYGHSFVAALGLRVIVGVDHVFPSSVDWLISGWRLSALIRHLGFNGRRHPEVEAWRRAIESQPASVLKATLRDPRGVPAVAPPVPSQFIWGLRDRVAPFPIGWSPSPRHQVIDADHSAPVTSAEEVAEIVIRSLES